MKKNLFLAIAVVFALSSCEKQAINEELQGLEESGKVRITFQVKNSTDARTRATALAASDMTDLWLLDYINNECVNSMHLTPDDEGWSAPSATFTIGSHDIYFVASRGDGGEIDETEGTIIWTVPRDTFLGSLTLNVTGGTSPAQSVELSRATMRLKINVNDAVPENIDRLIITPDIWYFGLNYLTGEAVGEKKEARSVTVPASYVGTTKKLTASFYGFSGDDEWQTDVEVKAVDADDNVLGQVTLTDAPFSKNVITEYSGMLFGGQVAMDVTLGDAWGENDMHTW